MSDDNPQDLTPEEEAAMEGRWPERALSDEVLAVCKKVHAMMEPPDGTAPEMARVTLNVPKGLLYLATHRAVFEQAKGGGTFWRDVESGETALDDKLCRAHRRRYLEDVLTAHLNQELEWFATLGHPLLYPEEEQPDGNPSGDDESRKR